MRFPLNVILILCFTFPTGAQIVISSKAGLITCAEGAVSVDGESFQFRAKSPRQLSEESCLQTGSGRVEVQLGPAAMLWMGENGSLRVLSRELTDTGLRLERGAMLIQIVEKYADGRLRIHIGDAHVELQDIGLYCILFDPPRLHVFKGKAEIRKENILKTAGKNKVVYLYDDIEIKSFNKYPIDSLLTWASHRSYVNYGRIEDIKSAEDMPTLSEKNRIESQKRWAEQMQRMEEARRKALERQR